VPNRHVSVYTRIWCVYEAFLAYSWGKPIFTATTPAPGITFHALAVIVRFGFFFALCYYALPPLTHQGVDILLPTFVIPLVAVSMFLRGPLARLLINEAGIISCALCGANSLQLSQSEGFVFPCIFCAFFVCREADRLWANQAEVEAAALRQGFTGRLQDAASSVAQDKATIFEAIQGLEQDVERAIEILIVAGMTTPSLRSSAASGVDISGAGSWSLGMVYGPFALFIFTPLVHIVLQRSCCGELVGALDVACAVTSFQGLCWVLGFARLSPDKRGFAASFAMLVAFLPHNVVYAVLTMMGMVCAGRVSDAIGAVSFAPLLLLSLWCGMERVIAIPCIGPFLVRSLMHPLRNDRAARWRPAVSRAGSGGPTASCDLDCGRASWSSDQSSDTSETEEANTDDPA